MTRIVAESPSGLRHAYATAYGHARTACGRPVPQHRGWFGPVRAAVTCSGCLAAITAEEQQ